MQMVVRSNCLLPERENDCNARNGERGRGGVGYSTEFGVIIIQKGELLFKKKRIFNIGLFLIKAGTKHVCTDGGLS